MQKISHTKLTICILLGLSSIGAGASLGLLDIFGFVDGRHALSFKLMLASVALLYISLVLVFLLEFTNDSKIYKFLAFASLLFAIPFYLMNLNIILTGIASVSYAAYLYYSYSASAQRASLYVKFSPSEIFFPIVKNGFMYLLILISLVSYFQSQKLVSHNALISKDMLKFLSRPAVLLLNQQINSQLKPTLDSPQMKKLDLEQRDEVIIKALRLTAHSMADPRSGKVYGIQPSDIPVERVHIREDGTIDIAPIVEGLFPQISDQLNSYIHTYALFVPLAVALLIFIVLQPISVPFQILESMLTILIFFILRKASILKVNEVERKVEVPYIE